MHKQKLNILQLVRVKLAQRAEVPSSILTVGNSFAHIVAIPYASLQCQYYQLGAFRKKIYGVTFPFP